MIGSRDDGDDSADCFECALVVLRNLRQDIIKKADLIQFDEELFEESEAAE